MTCVDVLRTAEMSQRRRLVLIDVSKE